MRKFCPECGQETHLEPLGIREYVVDWVEHYLAPGGILLRTIARLIGRPGQLTVDYREGRRNQFVRPMRLVFTLVLLSFLTSAVVELAGRDTIKLGLTQTAEYNKKLREQNLQKTLNMPIDKYVADRTTSAIKRDEILRDREAEIAALSMPVKNESAEYLKAKNTFNQRVLLYIVLLIAPALALLLKGLYWNRPFAYADYLVCALHLAAAWLIVGVVTQTLLLFLIQVPKILLAVALALLCVNATYLGLSLRRVYSGTVLNTVVRVFAFFAGAMLIAWPLGVLLTAIFDRVTATG